MHQKVKEFFDDLVIDEQEESDEGKFGHHPFQGLLISKKGKISMIAFAGVNTKIMMKFFTNRIVNNEKEIIISVDFPNCGDIMTDFIAVFSYIDSKIGIDLFPYDNKTGLKLGHIESGIVHDNFQKMVAHHINIEMNKK
jgi:hypothetical protein